MPWGWAVCETTAMSNQCSLRAIHHCCFTLLTLFLMLLGFLPGQKRQNVIQVKTHVLSFLFFYFSTQVLPSFSIFLLIIWFFYTNFYYYLLLFNKLKQHMPFIYTSHFNE